MTRAASTPVVCLLLALALAAPLGAIFVIPDLDNVPVERIVSNLERLVAEKPNDAHLRLNLARTHAMAFARKADRLQVARGSEAGGAFVSYREPDHVRRVPKPVVTSDPVKQAEARAHLAKALVRYEEAIRIADPSLALVARLGQAWAVEMSGDSARAVGLYRALITDAWEREDSRRTSGELVYQPVTAEAAGYLIPLLDEGRDKAEIAELRARIRHLERLPRPITPVAIPLRAGMDATDVVDRGVRVRFDADGSGRAQEWTWIARDAGWLVYEQRGAPMTSALQLFGTVTFRLFWRNGFDAMHVLDDDGDGRVAGEELRHLSIWRDADRNGVSERGEVRPLSAWGIVSLSYAHEIDEGDLVAAVAPRGVTVSDGSTRPAFDVWLRRW